MGRSGCLAVALWLVSAVAAAQPSSDPLARPADPRDVPPEVEPPSERGIDERCAEGASALWRGRPADAERLAREAIAHATAGAGAGAPSGAMRHAIARCHALLGRAILAGGSLDPVVHAEADAALRRAWALEPSRDLVDDLVSAHWLGADGAPLPIEAHAADRASPSERAALRGRPGTARTLRTTPTAGGPTWSVVLVELSRREEIVAVACARAGCVAEPLFSAWRAGGAADAPGAARARVAVVGFVPVERGLALVVGADHAVRAERVVAGRAARTDWEGSAVYVRWLEGGALAGWNVLTRSRLRAWDRALLGEGPPTRVDVRVRWGRGRVVLQPSGRLAADRLERVAGLRDPLLLARDRGWLGGLRPGHLFLPAP